MKAYIVWTDDLNTGILEIDDQHRKIVDYINALHNASIGSASIETDRHAIRSVIEQLTNYTDTHFKFEESLMEDAEYLFLTAHKRVHSLFIRKIDEYNKRFVAGEDIGDQLLETLQSWLVNHIKFEDANYALVVKKSMELQSKNESGWLAKRVKKFFG